MGNTRIWFDEVDFWKQPFQREPTVMEAFFETMANSHNWVRAADQQSAQRTYAKQKRRREQENCLHGRRLFRIHWQPGVHPAGDHIFYVNIDGLRGGPYLLDAIQHQVLHDEKQAHTHVSDRLV